MIDNLEYLDLPPKAVMIIIGLYLVMQLVGELLELKGKVVPEFFKIRKFFARKKQERKTLAEVQKTLAEFNSHYSADNIKMRDEWIKNVNHKLEENDELVKKLDAKLDKNSADTLSILIENKRSEIISFASYVIDERNPVTREQFNRIFKIYAEYETIIGEHNMTNGEVSIAYRIIKESYEQHLRHHSFVEDIRGYEPAK